MPQSTAVRKAARATPSDGVNGVVYYCVEDISGFSAGLAAAMGLKLSEISLAEAIVMRIIMQSSEKSAALKFEPERSWAILSKHLKAAAIDFR